MENILENIPFKESGMGSRKVVDEKHILIMQIALHSGQSVPQHNANSNVHLVVIRGEIVVDLDGTDHAAKEGTLLPVAYKTLMNIRNASQDDATFIVLKTPNPSEMR